MKRSPLKTKPNREKKAARFARQFHSVEFVEWMKAKPCCCGECPTGIPIWVNGEPWHTLELCEVHHVKSRGARGTWRDTVPLSRACHSEFHQKGRLSFCRARGWAPERLSELAAAYAAEWEAITSPPSPSSTGTSTTPDPLPG